MSEEVVIASVGKPVIMNRAVNVTEQPAQIQEQNIDTDINADEKPTGTEQANSDDKPLLELSPEQRQAFLKSIGFEGSEDDLKTKLQPVTSEPTPEQIALKEKEKDKRLLDLYLQKGGKVEDFVAMRQTITADPKEMGKAVLAAELKDAGIDDEDAERVSKQMLLQHDLENLEQGEEETDEDFTKRKSKLEKEVTLGAKKLADVGLPIIQKAKGVYDVLVEEIQRQDEDAAKEVELSSNIETAAKAVSREIHFDYEEVNGKKIDPVSVKIPEEELSAITTEVATILKDPKQRDAIFYDEKGDLKVNELFDLMVAKRILKHVSKQSLIEGQNRQVKIFESRFPGRTAAAVGLGGATAQRPPEKGKAVSFGKSQAVRK